MSALIILLAIVGFIVIVTSVLRRGAERVQNAADEGRAKLEKAKQEREGVPENDAICHYWLFEIEGACHPRNG